MSEWGVYSIVNIDSAKMIVTQQNLVPCPGQAYDARILAQAREKGRVAGKLFLEAQTQA
jgi:hypothetical protein